MPVNLLNLRLRTALALMQLDAELTFMIIVLLKAGWEPERIDLALYNASGMGQARRLMGLEVAE